MIDQDDARRLALQAKATALTWEYVAEYGPFEGVEACLTDFHEILNQVREVAAA